MTLLVIVTFDGVWCDTSASDDTSSKIISRIVANNNAYRQKNSCWRAQVTLTAWPLTRTVPRSYWYQVAIDSAFDSTQDRMISKQEVSDHKNRAELGLVAPKFGNIELVGILPVLW
jgi:hypothetical protein